ncbi:sensor domain-containing diguanylate cyclase [Brevibacillus nitrificans]|uniref:sensor domain-containing diguanylate cyclase n=1 Tax=Brevibacillus nitrificans TaxID=651560 RepID=UPI00260B7795|nr:sensor domain-containing diguanylate cyclase [Brevibacillus nitrificans]
MLPRKKLKQRQNISLTTLLTGLVSLSVLLTLTVLLFASYHSKKKSLIDTTLTLNYTSAVKMGQTIDSLFHSMQSSLRYSAAFLSDMNDKSSDELFFTLELIRRSSNYFNSIAVIDEKGLIRSASPMSLGTDRRYIGTPEAKAALALRKPYVSKPYVSTVSNRLMVFMSEPIYDNNGVYRGYIGGSIYLQENNVLTMIFANNPTDKLGSYFYIVSSNGDVLFHRDKSRIGENISENHIVRKLLENQSGHELAVNLRGEELLAGFVKVPSNGWGVVVASPIGVVSEQMNAQILGVILYTLVPFAFVMLIVIILARRLAKPFVSLANLVGKIGKEQVEIPVGKPHWNREVHLLTNAIRIAVREVTKQTNQLTQEAMSDPLTGLANRRTLEIIMHQWMQENTPFSLLIMDLDRFKMINDTYGHPSGDEVLKHFASIMALSTRPDDVCIRFGGEEFIVLIPYSSSAKAFIVAERIRSALENSRSPVGAPITVSVGVSHYPSLSISADELINLADQALYEAKESGRNQTRIARKPSESKPL